MIVILNWWNWEKIKVYSLLRGFVYFVICLFIGIKMEIF